MAGKKMNASSGYFNKEMLAILNKGEKKTTVAKKQTAKKTSKKK